MAETAATHTLRAPRWVPFAAAGVAAAIALGTSLGHLSLGDTDPYRHLEYAHLLWKSGFRLRGHPFLPFTLLGETSADLWLGFHLFCIPFTAFGMYWGARLAGAAVAATQTGVRTWLYRRAGQPRSWAFALAPLALSRYFQFRDHVARPAHLTVPLVELSLASGAGLLSPYWAAGAAFIYGLLHLSSPLAVVFAGVGAVAAGLSEKRWQFRPVLWSVGGLALALLVRPDRSAFLGVAWVTVAGAMGLGSGQHLFQSALELDRIGLIPLVKGNVALFALVILAIYLGGKYGRASSRPMRVATLLGFVLVTALTLFSGRFLDYVVPLGCFTMATWAPTELPRTSAVRVAAAIAGVAALAGLAWNMRYSMRLADRYFARPAAYESLADSLRKHVPAGSVVVTDDIIMTSVLWAYAPEYRYIGAYDPSTLYDAHPALFWRWSNMLEHGIDCDGPVCRRQPPDPQQIANVIHAFGSEYFVSFFPRKGYDVLAAMRDHPERFTLLALAPSTMGKMSLWHVVPAPTDAEWHLIDGAPKWMGQP